MMTMIVKRIMTVIPQRTLPTIAGVLNSLWLSSTTAAVGGPMFAFADCIGGLSRTELEVGTELEVLEKYQVDTMFSRHTYDITCAH